VTARLTSRDCPVAIRCLAVGHRLMGLRSAGLLLRDRPGWPGRLLPPLSGDRACDRAGAWTASGACGPVLTRSANWVDGAVPTKPPGAVFAVFESTDAGGWLQNMGRWEGSASVVVTGGHPRGFQYLLALARGA